MLMKLRNMIKGNEGQKGFTLIELIVVMAILALLAALAVPKVGTVLNESKAKAHNNNLDLIAHAAELYYDQKGTLPTDMSTLVNNHYLKTIPGVPNQDIGSGYSLGTVSNGIVLSPGSCNYNGTSFTSSASTTYTF
ncbi:competence type IV pilus major pilin ComGC [Syntrophomonas palmitatica]|uniref:competence type IV pilus major pilin ComGC n=1 Tax=Syntrophomonas palmitatica TaxID=402877 RepID=UPI0006D2B84A|nr:prepilin-type N-terminal cleavage/methylation domain-containing protein [Syntrophomonas palmitatica]